MKSSGPFVAQILDSGAGGYAGLAASLLLERHPEIGQRYEPGGFANWKNQFQRWLLDLSAAVGADEPRLFVSQITWTLEAFATRNVPLEDLREALEVLRDTLRQRLPDGAAEPALDVIDGALAAMALPSTVTEPGVRSTTAGRPALAYLQTILEGRPRDAVGQVLQAVADGTPVSDAYLNVLIPAQRETGRLWHAGELSIAEEHAVTATTRRAMALLSERAGASEWNGKTALMACVAGNVHDIGLGAIADFFEMAGWRTILLGPDVPYEEIARSVVDFGTEVVVLAAALPPHVREVGLAIERIRAIEGRDIRVIVGGTAFDGAPDLWRKLAADGYSPNIEGVEPLASRLTR